MTANARKKRRRKYSAEFRAQVLAEVNQPGVTIRAVAEKYNLAHSLIHLWRLQESQPDAPESEPLGFVHCGEIVDIVGKNDDASSANRQTLSVVTTPTTTLEANDYARSAFTRGSQSDGRPPTELMNRMAEQPGEYPGLIDIHLPQGVHILVDSFVNEAALCRVLRSLRDAV